MERDLSLKDQTVKTVKTVKTSISQCEAQIKHDPNVNPRRLFCRNEQVYSKIQMKMKEFRVAKTNLKNNKVVGG